MADTATAITLTIPGTPAFSLSPNSRTHWAVKQRETKDAQWAVRAALINRDPYFPLIDEYSPKWPIDGPVRLHWMVYLAKGGKKRDPDNMLACLKAHTDALVDEVVIGGDSPRWIPETPTVEQVTWGDHKGDPHIVVTIEALS